MSAYLETKAKTGDRLVLNGPFGSFYLRTPRRPILLLAGGTGVGPILSMLEHLAARVLTISPCDSFTGARDDADLVEVERIEALAARIPKFTYDTTCRAWKPASAGPPCAAIILAPARCERLDPFDLDQIRRHRARRKRVARA